VLVVTGAGTRVFVAGGDLKELAAIRTHDDAVAMAHTMRTVLDRIATLPVPVLAAVNGDAYGGGAEVAVACDIRIAADDVRCGFNQVALGIMPAWGGIERLTALVGRGRALMLMTTGRVFLAQPPLYRIDIGKETFWALDDAHKDRLLKVHGNGRANAEITRFKGLGEMMPKVLWETTLNPRTRRLLRVDVVDQITTDRVINELMGKDPSARFRFIMERADEAEELDV